MDEINKEFARLSRWVAGALVASVKWIALFGQTIEDEKFTDLVNSSYKIAVSRVNELSAQGQKNDANRLAFFLDCLNHSKEIFVALDEKIVDEEFRQVLERNLKYCLDGIQAVAELSAKLPE